MSIIKNEIRRNLDENGRDVVYKDGKEYHRVSMTTGDRNNNFLMSTSRGERVFIPRDSVRTALPFHHHQLTDKEKLLCNISPISTPTIEDDYIYVSSGMGMVRIHKEQIKFWAQQFESENINE